MDPTPRPVVVLSHGMGDSAAAWDALVPLLEPHAHVHRWTLRGHGDRSWDALADGDGDYTVARAADDLAAEVATARAATGAERVVLVGHSLGGYLSLLHTLDHRAEVAGLGLVATGPGFRNPEARSRWNEYAVAVGLKAGFPREVAAVAEQHDSTVMDRLGELDGLPLVHVVGERDERFLAGAAHIQKVLPSSRLVLVAGAGHHPQRSHPAEVAVALLPLLSR